ncbi:aldo/keto reductase [Paenibacillus sp. LMG 31458]|uniref:Aldo/keto reductase n=1 Tax=Paenibacillus phytorum TaxID=2654977 RepID=A0ABX1Y2B7_9BACL|nr:aldo/keto reductase [Paenibacillus phytorum]NOU74729.1 aldo/keto reductase [Paenibacillus phytorum]
MKYRKFGNTEWDVSEIGFGGWQIGGGGAFGQVDDCESVKTLLEAWDRGINLVDTAQMYGKGHSEEVIGMALKEWNRDHIYIASKVQPVQWPHPNEIDPDMTGRYPEAHIRKQCEDSLTRLGVEAIDLYQLHGWFPKGLEDREWHEALTELQKEGKIREFGVSIRDYRPQDGIALAEAGLIQAQQVVYNVFEQRPAEELFPVCKKSGLAVLARVPFDEGSLIGSWTPETYETFAPGDVRRSYFKGDRFVRTLEKVEAIKQTIREYDATMTLAEVALRFCLSDEAVSCVIPGMRNAKELEANLKVSDGKPLPAELLEQLKSFNWPRNYHNPDTLVDPL